MAKGGLGAGERSVLQLVCTGMTDAEIGRRLGWDETDVTSMIDTISRKLRCRTRGELVVRAALEAL